MTAQRGYGNRIGRITSGGWKAATASVYLAAALLFAHPATNCQAQNSDGHPSMANVTDVTGGLTYLLQNDDLVLLQTTTANNGNDFITSVVNLDTSNSQISGTNTTQIASSPKGSSFNPTTGIVSSEAVGRMYNIKSDTIAVLAAVQTGSSAAWEVTLFNPLTSFKGGYRWNTHFDPSGTVYTRVVMGDFQGNRLVDPLLFYSNNLGSQDGQWAMRALAAQDPATEGAPKAGPEFVHQGTSYPLAESITVGDFNGDGRDEIAALLSDYQTVAFYSVDPTTLQITQTGTLKLPVHMVLGQVALAAGRFRNLSPGVTNADLVIFGQIYRQKNGYSVIPVQMTPDPAGTGKFTGQVVEPFFRFPDFHGSSGALAQAAPLFYSPQVTQEELVLGIQTQDGASYILIGGFQLDASEQNIQTFDWYSKTEREYDGSFDYLKSLSVGKFDNLNSGNGYNAGFQVQTQEYVSIPFLNYTPHLLIFDIDLPQQIPPLPNTPVGNWLHQRQDYSLEPFQPNSASLTPRTDILVAGDTQGRSLRLGAPNIVRINSQTQPDLILAVPPMHVDYIATHIQDQSAFPGCTNPNVPCIANVSVKPSVPPSQGTPFATSFSFDSSTSSSAEQNDTTSWGISEKVTVGENINFNDGLENASIKIKNATKIAYDQTVSKTWNTYTSTTKKVTQTTGFADHIFYKNRGVNVYYYPVLGCETDGANCTEDGQKEPLWVEFSVPDHVTRADIDGSMLEWYQPVHEPGNILSYPWSQAQLAARFTSKLTPLTTQANCTSIGSGTQTSGTTWISGSSTKQSSGATNSFSNELSMSESVGAGISGVDNADVNFSVDVATNNSLNTLNQSTTALSSSQGISLSIPEFTTGNCCSYAFGQYIYGLKDTKHPATEEACLADQDPATDNCVAVKDPEGKALGIAASGPLFTGYVASPLNTGELSTCGNNTSWWVQAYPTPDVALNHPERWTWTKSTQTVSFNKADTTGNVSPILQQFYPMKGFFITTKAAYEEAQDKTRVSSPNLQEASPSDQLILATRVYNYSLVDTPANAQVHVRFYGQLYCPDKGDVCGNSFQIGEDQKIAAIAGFQSLNPNDNNAPNWKLASVEFDPSSYGATKNGSVNMVFWVVVWMQNTSTGRLVAEMPGHGLTAIPGVNIDQILREPIEPYSNNVGLYGAHQQFYLKPVNAPPSSTGAHGTLSSLSLAVDSKLPLDVRTALSSTIRVAGAPVDGVNVAYYDGDPSKNGVLLDLQRIAHLSPRSSYKHNSFFTPSTCGTHTLYVKAWIADSPAAQANAITTVFGDRNACHSH